MMRLAGSILRSRLVLRMRSGMVVRRVAMQIHGLHLMMGLRGFSEERTVEAGRGTGAPGKAGRRREHAEQIGEGNEAPHPDPHRSRHSQQHGFNGPIARQCARAIAT